MQCLLLTCTLVYACILVSVQFLLVTCISYWKRADFIVHMHFLTIYRLFILIAYVGYCKRKGWLCALGGGGGGDRGGPAYNSCTIFCDQVAHYLYYCAHNTKTCSENMQLLWKTCSACYIHAHWYMHLCLHLSSAYWIHAHHIGSNLISLDTCNSCWIQAVHIDCICRVLQAERMELCALGGGGGGDRGGPAYN